jgi:hypothetical protein
MKLVFIALALLLLIAISSAESIYLGDYNFTFNMSQSHVVDNNTIRTYYGDATLEVIRGWGVYLPKETIHIGDVASQNKTFDMLLLGNKYIGLAGYHDTNSTITLESTMNLTDTVEFLKNLKIERQ